MECDELLKSYKRNKGPVDFFIKDIIDLYEKEGKIVESVGYDDRSLLIYQLHIDIETLTPLIFDKNFKDYYKKAVHKNTIYTTFAWNACLKDTDIFNAEEVAEILTHILGFSDISKLGELKNPETIASKVFPNYEP